MLHFPEQQIKTKYAFLKTQQHFSGTIPVVD
jgi:hypothetical protein